MGFEIESWIIIAILAFVAAGTVKGILGIGLPVTAIGLMAQFVDPATAISLMVFPIMIGNFWQFYRSGNLLATMRKYWLLGVVLAIALMLTTFYTVRVSASFLVGFVGVAVVTFSIMNLAFNPRFIPEGFDRIAQFICGILSGILGGFTAIWAPPIAAYLISKKTEKEEFVRATGFLFSVGSIPLFLGFWLNGMLTGSIAIISGAMIIPTLIGFSLGEVIRKKIHPRKFKKLVLIFFLFIGLNLIRKAIFP